MVILYIFILYFSTLTRIHVVCLSVTTCRA